VSVGNPAGNREIEAAARNFARARLVGTIEPIKDVRQIGVGDANSQSAISTMAWGSSELSLTKIPCSLLHMPFPETNRKAGEFAAQLESGE
jgi:hypothetical protein